MKHLLRKLLPLVIVSVLLGSCVTASAPHPVKCNLPDWPTAPNIDVWPCQFLDKTVDSGISWALCMSNQTAVDLGLWVRAAEQYHQAAEACK